MPVAADRKRAGGPGAGDEELAPRQASRHLVLAVRSVMNS